MRRIFCLVAGVVLSCAFILSCKHELPEPAGGGGTNPPGAACSPDSVYFQQQVLPIFISNCSMSGCHDAASHQDGVILTSYSSIMSTGGVRPGNPTDSDLYEKITENDPRDVMPPPPQAPLSQQQKEIIFKWIAQGAKNNSCETTSCDTANVTFTSSVKTIITNKCQGCHGGGAPQGGINLTTYTDVKAKVDDGKLWGSINHLQGFSPMPKNGIKLSDCEIAVFRKWIAAGAPNN